MATSRLKKRGQLQKNTSKAVVMSDNSALTQKIELFFQKNESTMSLILGIIVVIVSATLLFRYVKVWKNRVGSIPEATSTIEPVAAETTKLPENINLSETDGKIMPQGLPTTYVVQKGDSSWKVAKAFYGSGYNYVDIEKANSLKHNQHLEIGMKLSIPKTEVIGVKKAVKTPESVALGKENSMPETYTVQKGDHLWKIAVKFYGDGYKWTEIYKLNLTSIKNPGIIEIGLVLKLPAR